MGVLGVDAVRTIGLTRFTGVNDRTGVTDRTRAHCTTTGTIGGGAPEPALAGLGGLTMTCAPATGTIGV